MKLFNIDKTRTHIEIRFLFLKMSFKRKKKFKEITYKILAAYHKPYKLLKTQNVVPIHLGRTLAHNASKDGEMSEEDYQWMTDNMIGDDTGDNISSLNRYFNEMTGIYWAWKNYDKLDNPEYIGLMHYRAVFLFAGYPQMKDNYLQDLGYDYVEGILSKYEKYIISGEWWNPDVTIYEHHKRATLGENPCHFNLGFFDSLYEILEKKYKNYDFRKWVEAKKGGPWKNMFIMPRDEFFEYCEFIFPVLFDIYEKYKDFNYKNVVEKRNIGYISEYLTAYFIDKLSKRKEIHTITVPIVRI